MNATCYGIAITLFSSMGSGGSHYTRSSIDTLRKNLKRFHKIDVGRRWIFQCLKNMIDAGYITRKTRYRQDVFGKISQIPSLFAFTISGIKNLVARRVTGAAKLLKNMIKFITGNDQRWPKEKDVANIHQEEVFRPNKEAFDKIRRGLIKSL